MIMNITASAANVSYTIVLEINEKLGRYREV